MRQEITRAHKGWALDTVVLDNDVTKLMKEEITTPPSEGKLNDDYFIFNEALLLQRTSITIVM